MISDIRKSYQNKTVLVVDDQETNQILMSAFLEEFYQLIPSIAKNGLEAVEMASHKLYDLIFMDINMPVMDGIEATRIIKDLCPDLPIVAFTTISLAQSRDILWNVGMVDHLDKPIDPTQLHSILEKYLDHSLAF